MVAMRKTCQEIAGKLTCLVWIEAGDEWLSVVGDRGTSHIIQVH